MCMRGQRWVTCTDPLLSSGCGARVTRHHVCYHPDEGRQHECVLRTNRDGSRRHRSPDSAPEPDRTQPLIHHGRGGQRPWQPFPFQQLLLPLSRFLCQQLLQRYLLSLRWPGFFGGGKPAASENSVISRQETSLVLSRHVTLHHPTREGGRHYMNFIPSFHCFWRYLLLFWQCFRFHGDEANCASSVGLLWTGRRHHRF